ncbi:MAG: NUDIX hydrolase, partial [Thermoleophilaceae bacterium]|nr:NUDIX hydrolase [Thermoleophilaceae bacterium]
PNPGEELNPGDETPARLAASAIVLRDGDDGVDVLLVQRNPDASFMGGAWVFPGGSVHDSDDGERGAALRELEEEAALAVRDPDELVAFSRWVTPAEVKKRFDTWFFVMRAPQGQEPKVDDAECVDFRWISPRGALEAGERGELLLVFPTIKHLEQLAELESVDHALEVARGRTVEPVQPRVIVKDDHAQVLLPGEPGYED